MFVFQERNNSFLSCFRGQLYLLFLIIYKHYLRSNFHICFLCGIYYDFLNISKTLIFIKRYKCFLFIDLKTKISDLYGFVSLPKICTFVLNLYLNVYLRTSKRQRHFSLVSSVLRDFSPTKDAILINFKSTILRY